MGMGCQRTMTGASMDQANREFVFPHQNNGGCTDMESLGWLHGTGNDHVGVWWDR